MIPISRPTDLIRLENRWCRLEFEPLGARMRHLSSAAGENWLWEPEPRPQEPAFGAGYEDHWRGGFEELFPNDAPTIFDERRLVDHGELWCSPWEVAEMASARARFKLDCRTVPARVEKTISLAEDGSRVTIAYSLRNTGDQRLYHLFKLHPAIRVEAGDRLLLPGGEAVPVDPAFSRIASGPFRWPIAAGSDGRPFDLSRLPGPESRLLEFVYVKDMPEGWCGVRRRTGETLRLEYPLSVFPSCWLFMTFGGWRGHHTVVLEPCTNMPKDLEEARRHGTCAVLESGEEKRFSVSITIGKAGAAHAV